MKRAWAYIALISLAGPAQALELSFTGPATLTHSAVAEFDSYKMPIGPFRDGALPTLVAEGPREQIAWQVKSASGTTLGVADNLRRQIEAVGFELLYECETSECGGFDFRFGTDVLPEPDMHIDLGDFRYIAAQRLGAAVPEYLSLFVSRSDELGYVQMIRVGGAETTPATPAAPEASIPQPGSATRDLPPLIERLERKGSAVLQDLVFATGSADLGDGDYKTLTALADYLQGNSDRRIALVGHTDAEGSLQANISLSRQRARSVRTRLIGLGVDGARIEAEGVGYLAPLASNLTEEGRTQNRRVEVILTSTQ